jgi:hypothetical protein
MAPDYDKPKTIAGWSQKSGFREFDFTTHDNRADVNRGLSVLLDCANLLFDSETATEIKLGPGVTGRMLEMMSILLMRAAHTTEDKRELMFKFWAEQGPLRIDELIETVKARDGKTMVRDDVSMFMGCPDGYEI